MSWITRIFGRTGDASPPGATALMEEEGAVRATPLTPGSGPTATVPALPSEPSITPAGDGVASAPVPESGIAPLVPEVNDEVLVGFGSGNEEGRNYAGQVETPEPQPTLEEVAPVHPPDQESATDQLADAFAGTVPTPPRPDFESDVVLAPPPGVVPPPLAPDNRLAEAADTGQQNAWPNKVDLGLDYDAGTDDAPAIPPMPAPEADLAGKDGAEEINYTLFQADGVPLRGSVGGSAEPEAAPSEVARWNFENAWPSKLEEPPAEAGDGLAAAANTRWTGPTLSSEIEAPNLSFHIPESDQPSAGVEHQDSWSVQPGAAASGSPGVGVLRSQDGGQTWSETKPAPAGEFQQASGLGSETTLAEARVDQPAAATGGAAPEAVPASRDSPPSSLLADDREYEPSTLAELKPSDSLTTIVNPPPAAADIDTELEPDDLMDDADL